MSSLSLLFIFCLLVVVFCFIFLWSTSPLYLHQVPLYLDLRVCLELIVMSFKLMHHRLYLTPASLKMSEVEIVKMKRLFEFCGYCL